MAQVTAKGHYFTPGVLQGSWQSLVDEITFVRYAIHNSGVGMTLRKAGESSVEVKTVTGNSIVDNIRTIYGPAIAKELVDFSMEEDKLKFSAKGQISNVNYHVKKFVFLLFINNRLVESSALKRAIESVYQPYLPKVVY